MVLGVGIDFCELDRIEALMARLGERFLARVFNPAEIEFIQAGRSPALRSAGLFAGKEAVVKCLGTGFSCGVGWKQAEVRPRTTAGYEVVLHGEALRRASEHGETRWWIDICYDRTHAAAAAVWVRC